jgi:transcriptional regulator with XRE-family HTH domain
MNTIRNHRKKLRLTQSALAQKMGTDQTAISKWERGQAMPRAEKLPALARVLHCRIDDLYAGPEEKEGGV